MNDRKQTLSLPTAEPRCVLRPWRDGDQDALVRHADNRRVWRNLTHLFPHPYTRQDAEFWLSMASEPSRSTHLAITFDGEAVGGIGAIAGEGVGARTAEFGYWIGEAFWGRGLATAAAAAFKTHLMEQGEFVRLQAGVFAWNPASMRVLEKVGFQREGVLRRAVSKDGDIVDCVMYAYVSADHPYGRRA